ncbi:MAG TPA: acyl-CoA thioesterase [Candidatus Gallacutalibacter pullicola]|uniref:Acyl-CoA thioesterase n=1 Tax=Candidatus Gallacutalibacter pullicola TaxID=2840830 RepID=A0A9D1J1X0_9FIRM|nr:acyl-CoA thioesterase [Candidatus Gallacutalibacter pullicola]
MKTETKITVRYAETDQMGVTHHAVYPVWYEAARTDLIKETGVSYSQLEKMGVMTPVVDLSCHYSGVTHYEDIVTVQCWISRLTPARIEFSYATFCGDSEKPCNTGKSLHGCVDAKTFRPINLKKRFPEFYAKLESMVEPDA